MNDKQLQAIRARRIFLEMLFSKDGRQQEKAGVVSLSRVLFFLATRFIDRPEWPGHEVEEGTKLLWEMQWYFDYLMALGELSPLIQAAILGNKITPRSGMTRSPLVSERLHSWLELDISAEIARDSKDFWENNPLANAMDSGWPDASAMPAGVCVAFDDVVAWAEAEGIATADDLAALAQRNEGKQNPTYTLPERVNESNVEQNADAQLAELFDPVTAEVLEKMFPAGNKWKSWCARAARNGLIKARDTRARYNPYRAAQFFFKQGVEGWDWARCLRCLANNLPARSMDSSYLITGRTE